MATVVYTQPEFTLTIASGQTESDTIDLHGAGNIKPRAMHLYAPATLPETISLHTAPRATATFAPLMSNGTAIPVAAASNQIIYPFQAGAFKLVSGAAVAADRTFNLSLSSTVL